MRKRHDLRLRVAIAFATFGALISFLMGIFLQWAAHDLGQRLIDDTLTAELDDYFARRERNPHSKPPNTITLHGYVRSGHENGEVLPPYLPPLLPGRHDITVGALSYRVAVADHQEDRYYFLYDTSLQQRRERRFTLQIGATIILVVLCAAVGGFWLVGVIIAPVTELAKQVRNRSPDDWSLRMADDFAHDEVGELAHAFDLHLGRIRAFMERERAFTADLSHELRTSLAVISSATEILLSDDTLTEKQKNRVLRVERAAREMGEMGTALMLMARERHAMAIESTTRVAEVIDEAVEKHRFLLKSKPIQVVVATSPDLVVPADRGLVFIAVANLIRNAFSYTEQGEIRITQDPSSLTVSDTGCGMREEQTARILFSPFYAITHARGSGIGLSLVKRICDQYGWKIRVTSQERCGTAIRIEFFSH
ncbi:MAG: HAMP domain-containing histidine kinase [Magnetococcales bacterium]|nr:HAMP domain-containing histidine kinase [Magnetococcales bacterium]